MLKMVNNSEVNTPFYQEKRKIGGRSDGIGKHVVDSDQGRANSADNEHLRKIFVGGLSIHTSAETMHTFFSQFGVVCDAVVMRDPISNRSRGFGFVTYVDPGAVEKVQSARPHIIDCKTVDTKRAFPRYEFNKAIGHLSNIKTKKIFLGGLKDCHDESTLREYFTQFGVVRSVKVILDKETGRKRGFGFLEFEHTSGAARALDQSKHSVKLIDIEVKKSIQQFDSTKRLRLPIGGAACAGYAPPQPTMMDSLVYNPNYNPYEAQTVLPPSAFLNGWASYVAPKIPLSYLHHQAPLPRGKSHINSSNVARNNHSSPEWQPKGEQKFTSAKAVQTVKNEFKSIHSEEATKKLATDDTKMKNNITDNVAKKWLAKEYKIFEPTGRYNFGTTPANHKTSSNNGLSTPAYGI